MVVAYFCITSVSNFTRDNHKLFVLTSKRIYDTELSFLLADKWPEMKKKLSWIRLVKASVLTYAVTEKMEVLLIVLFLDNYLLFIHYTKHKSN